jgi:hypothetical protein
LDSSGENCYVLNQKVVCSSASSQCEDQFTWPASDWAAPAPGTGTKSGNCDVNPDFQPLLTWEHCDVSDPTNSVWGPVCGLGGLLGTGWDKQTYRRQADVVPGLRTGGKEMAGRQSLWRISGSTAETKPGGHFQ